MTPESGTAERYDAALPAAALGFIVLWSSAFVATRAGLSDVSPLLFLTVRFALAATILAVVLVVIHADWALLRTHGRDLFIAGSLINGVYLAGAYLAMTEINAASMALIGALHPIATAVIAGWLLDERMTRRQWLGLALGVAGVALLVGGEVRSPSDLAAPLLGAGGVLALALGSVHYRRRCHDVPLLLANGVQLGAAAAVCTVLLVLFETPQAVWTASAVGTLLYLTVVVSLCAQLLLMFMLRRGSAGKVASNFYLTPGVTALIGWLFLKESLHAIALGGLLVASVGVWLAQRGH